jgi:gluconate kinase
MPPALLQSQFDALEEPAAEEAALTIAIDAAPDEIVSRIVAALGLSHEAPA